MQKLSTQTLLERWEDRRAVQNIMGKFSQSYTRTEEELIYDRFWSKRSDVCMGVNDGWYKGAEAVKGYYEALKAKNKLRSRLIKEHFSSELGQRTEEECLGVGILGYKPVDTCVVEVASDGQTAKGLWCVRGTYVELESTGFVSYAEFSYLAVDFIKDPEGWKIWHLQNLFDVNHTTGSGWGEPEVKFDEVPDFAAMKDFHMPEPNVKAQLRQLYSPMRGFAPSPELPEPYDTFAETFSYGIE